MYTRTQYLYFEYKATYWSPRPHTDHNMPHVTTRRAHHTYAPRTTHTHLVPVPTGQNQHPSLALPDQNLVDMRAGITELFMLELKCEMPLPTKKSIHDKEGINP